MDSTFKFFFGVFKYTAYCSALYHWYGINVYTQQVRESLYEFSKTVRTIVMYSSRGFK